MPKNQKEKAKEIIILGSGFSSLTASCYLAKQGFNVTILEKNESIGGRARQLKKDGFTFDMGPTFYWMPDVFESFFKDFNVAVNECYDLEKLNPAYQVYFGPSDSISIPDTLDKIIQVFEKTEPGSGKMLQKFITNAESNYKLAINNLVYQPGKSLLEITTFKTLKKLNLFFLSIKKQVAQHIKNDSLRKILEFPVLFLGATPTSTPAFYNFMNYADFGLGTWHPKGGMFSVVNAMEKLALNLGVTIKVNSEVTGFEFDQNSISKVKTKDQNWDCDIVLSGADYAHTESLLPKPMRQYSDSYWNKKVFAPSALIFYVGFSKKLKNISHHTLFFDTDFEQHATDIYETKKWTEKPLFYGSFPSITDETVAPKEQEAAIFLIPIATDSEDTEEIRTKYFNKIIGRLEEITNQSVKEDVLFYESYCVKDFKEDYNAYGGNAYGLANTLLQTHILRPKLDSKKVKNLYFAGQLTVPGPGVPPSIISGKIVSELIKKKYESTI